MVRFDPPTIPDGWKGSAFYAEGERVIPSSGKERWEFRCTVPGTTGALEPSWPAATGELVVDGTVTWECLVGVIRLDQDSDFLEDQIVEEFQPTKSQTILYDRNWTKQGPTDLVPDDSQMGTTEAEGQAWRAYAGEDWRREERVAPKRLLERVPDAKEGDPVESYLSLARIARREAERLQGGFLGRIGTVIIKLYLSGPVRDMWIGGKVRVRSATLGQGSLDGPGSLGLVKGLSTVEGHFGSVNVIVPGETVEIE
jgi:hypothetical protein